MIEVMKGTTIPVVAIRSSSGRADDGNRASDGRACFLQGREDKLPSGVGFTHLLDHRRELGPSPLARRTSPLLRAQRLWALEPVVCVSKLRRLVGMVRSQLDYAWRELRVIAT